MLALLVMAILVMGLALVIGASLSWLARYGSHPTLAGREDET